MTIFINMKDAPASLTDEYASILSDIKLLRLVVRDLVKVGVKISMGDHADDFTEEGWIPLYGTNPDPTDGGAI